MPDTFVTRRADELADVETGVDEIHPIRPCDVVLTVATGILGGIAAALLVFAAVVVR